VTFYGDSPVLQPFVPYPNKFSWDKNVPLSHGGAKAGMDVQRKLQFVVKMKLKDLREHVLRK